MTNSISIHANGKLLLSGEYFVLDGALAVGLPCRFGQQLHIEKTENNNLISWKSLSINNKVWFEGIFQKTSLNILENSDRRTAETLQHILQTARELNPDFLNFEGGCTAKTVLEFPRLWGLGSSSTLIYNIAKWSNIDPFILSSKTLGGSGYDIACAGANQPILYRLDNGVSSFEFTDFNPVFKEHLYFIYLDQKQNSREGIRHYRSKSKNQKIKSSEISAISKSMINATNIEDFKRLIRKHEEIVSKTIELPKVKDRYFTDFPGEVKSLGAWGGDFVLAISEIGHSEVKNYFNKKGLQTFFRYEEMVKEVKN